MFFHRSRASSALLALAASFVLTASVVAKDKGKKKHHPDAGAADAGSQRIVVAGVREPSGIAWHPGLHHLFVVGDEGTLGELDPNGRTIRADRVAGNLEDLAFHSPSGMLVLLVENPAGLVVYDAASHRETRRITLDTAGLLGRAPEGGKAQGFEGLAFRAEAGRPGGGVFYIAYQRSPAMVVAAGFDPLRAATVGQDEVVERWPMDPYRHLTALTYDSSRERFLLIADGRVAVIGRDGKTQSQSEMLPMLHPEGVCLDESGALWIADDPTGLLRVPGGVDGLSRPVGLEGVDPSQPAALQVRREQATAAPFLQ
jgi:uncharacterized protein YjiK